MAARKYSVVGRYMTGPEVTGYQLISDTSTESKKYSKEALAFLIGKGAVVNCDAQIYNGNIVLRGVGIQINTLPIVSDKDGKISNAEKLGKPKRNETTDDTLSKSMIIGRVEKELADGRRVIGYVIMNAGGVKRVINKDELINLTQSNRIGNARVQNYNGKTLLRGIGIDLRNLQKLN